MDTNQRHAQAQYEVRQTSREYATTDWRKKERGFEGKEMRAAKLQEMEEMGTELQASARRLPSGITRDNMLQEIGRFRAQIAALQGADLRPAEQGLKAKQ